MGAHSRLINVRPALALAPAAASSSMAARQSKYKNMSMATRSFLVTDRRQSTHSQETNSMPIQISASQSSNVSDRLTGRLQSRDASKSKADRHTLVRINSVE